MQENQKMPNLGVQSFFLLFLKPGNILVSGSIKKTKQLWYWQVPKRHDLKESNPRGGLWSHSLVRGIGLKRFCVSDFTPCPRVFSYCFCFNNLDTLSCSSMSLRCFLKVKNISSLLIWTHDKVFICVMSTLPPHSRLPISVVTGQTRTIVHERSMFHANLSYDRDNSATGKKRAGKMTT